MTKGRVAAQSKGSGAHGAPAGSSKERILDAARAEFLEKGFQGASMRAIASAAGMTTGAIYGYFSSKEDLFDALVRPFADELFSRCVAFDSDFQGRAPERKGFDEMVAYDRGVRRELIEFIHRHPDEVRLIEECSSGTGWADFHERFVELEVDGTMRYIESMRAAGMDYAAVPDEVIRTLSAYAVKSFLEAAAHVSDVEEAVARCGVYADFFHAGFEHILTGRSSS